MNVRPRSSAICLSPSGIRIGVGGGDLSFRNHRSPLHLFAESLMERSRLERSRHLTNSTSVEISASRSVGSSKNEKDIFSMFYFWRQLYMFKAILLSVIKT